MKKKILLTGILLFLVLLMQFCGVRIYTTPVFLEKAAQHRIIAILPFEMVFTGKQPKKLSPEQIQKLEEVESIAFQQSLYDLLSRERSRPEYPVLIDIMPVTRTNRLLDENGIGIRESWQMDTGELARILGVDAVVRTRVMKRRYMSELASLGIELGNLLVNALLDDSPLIVFFPNPTNRIQAECVLLNGRDGDVLWNVDVTDEIDWRMKSNDIINGINRFFAKRFPYR